jgi:hypothetical protein
MSTAVETFVEAGQTDSFVVEMDGWMDGVDQSAAWLVAWLGWVLVGLAGTLGTARTGWLGWCTCLFTQLLTLACWLARLS